MALEDVASLAASSSETRQHPVSDRHNLDIIRHARTSARRDLREQRRLQLKAAVEQMMDEATQAFTLLCSVMLLCH